MKNMKSFDEFKNDLFAKEHYGFGELIKTNQKYAPYSHKRNLKR